MTKQSFLTRRSHKLIFHFFVEHVCFRFCFNYNKSYIFNNSLRRVILNVYPTVKCLYLPKWYWLIQHFFNLSQIWFWTLQFCSALGSSWSCLSESVFRFRLKQLLDCRQRIAQLLKIPQLVVIYVDKKQEHTQYEHCGTADFMTEDSENKQSKRIFCLLHFR